MLGQNPGAYGLPETSLALFDTLDVVVRELTGMRGSQLHGLVRSLAQLLSGEQSHASVEMAWRWIMNHVHWPTGWVRHFLEDQVAPLRLVERNTSVLFDPEATLLFQGQSAGADFVHISRNPRVVGTAIMGDGKGAVAALMGSYDDRGVDQGAAEVLDPQFLWVRAERAIDSLLAGVPAGRIHRVAAEDLAQNPETTLRALAKGLDLPSDAAAVARMMRPEASVFAGPGPMGAPLGDFPDFLANPHLPAPDPVVSLAGALPWRDDGSPFLPETLRLAQTRGYS